MRKDDHVYNSISERAFEDELSKIARAGGRESDKGFGRGIGYTAGAIAASQVVMIPQMMNLRKNPEIGRFVNRATSKFKDGNISKSDYKFTRQLKSTMKAQKTDVIIGGRTPKMGGGGAYMPESGAVHVAKTGKNLSNFEKNIMGHELGHSKNFRKLKKYKVSTPYMISRALVPLTTAAGVIGAAATDDDKKARNIAAIATVPTGIRLAEEATATTRGLKGVAKTYGGGFKGLGKALFKGKLGGVRAHGMSMLSYGIGAALPAIAYKASR